MEFNFLHNHIDFDIIVILNNKDIRYTFSHENLNFNVSFKLTKNGIYK